MADKKINELPDESTMPGGAIKLIFIGDAADGKLYHGAKTSGGGTGSRIGKAQTTAALSALSGINYDFAILFKTDDYLDNVNGLYAFDNSSGEFPASGGGFWKKWIPAMLNDGSWNAQRRLQIFDNQTIGPGGAYSAGKPPLYGYIRNDAGEGLNSAWGAMICGSAQGGAINFLNDFSNAANRGLKLGLIDNNFSFTNCLEIHYSTGGNTAILSIPLVPSTANTQTVGQKALPFRGFAFRSQAADPVAADLPDGTFSVFKNTSTGILKLWANDGGTMKSVSLT